MSKKIGLRCSCRRNRCGISPRASRCSVLQVELRARLGGLGNLLDVPLRLVVTVQVCLSAWGIIANPAVVSLFSNVCGLPFLMRGIFEDFVGLKAGKLVDMATCGVVLVKVGLCPECKIAGITFVLLSTPIVCDNSLRGSQSLPSVGLRIPFAPLSLPCLKIARLKTVITSRSGSSALLTTSLLAFDFLSCNLI